MLTTTASLKAQFDLQTRWFGNVLDNISDPESHIRDHKQLNHLKWIAGHLLNTRLTSMSRIVGLQPDESYKTQFARGAALENNNVYPSIEQIVTRWNDTAAAISEGILQIPEEVLSMPATAKAPIADETVRGMLSFLISHEAFHIGQMSVIRKLIGKEAMSYL